MQMMDAEISNNQTGTFIFQLSIEILCYLNTVSCILELFHILKKGNFAVFFHPERDICKAHVHAVFIAGRKNQKVILFERALHKLLGPKISDKNGLHEHLKKIVLQIPPCMDTVIKFAQSMFGYGSTESNIEDHKSSNHLAIKALHSFWKEMNGKDITPTGDCLSIFKFKEAKAVLINSGTVCPESFSSNDVQELGEQLDGSSEGTQAMR